MSENVCKGGVQENAKQKNKVIPGAMKLEDIDDSVVKEEFFHFIEIKDDLIEIKEEIHNEPDCLDNKEDIKKEETEEMGSKEMVKVFKVNVKEENVEQTTRLDVKKGKKQTRRKKVIKLNCDECSYVATRSNYLKKHVEAQHLGIKYTCDLCNHSTKTNGDLNRHRKIKHGGVRYPCKQCDFVSVRLGYLKEHVMAKHEGVRYPCDQCEYAATFPGGLRRHKESRHDGRKFPCDQCDFSATTSGSLVRHKRSLHEGVKWGCDLCNASYTFALALKRHKKKIHGEISVNKNNKIEKPIRVISATERMAKRAKN